MVNRQYLRPPHHGPETPGTWTLPVHPAPQLPNTPTTASSCYRPEQFGKEQCESIGRKGVGRFMGLRLRHVGLTMHIVEVHLDPYRGLLIAAYLASPQFGNVMMQCLMYGIIVT